MLRLAPVIVGVFVSLVIVLGFARTLWRARRDGVLTLPKGDRIERSADPARFDRYLGDLVRSMALPTSFAVGAILVGALALWIALTYDAG